MKKLVSVVYLARLADGSDEIAEFLKSYKAFPTTISHNLVIIAKGVNKNSDCQNIELLLLEHAAEANIVWVNDDIGFDIDAYKWIANNAALDTEFILCLKTSSRIMTPNWLEKYINLFKNPKVGLVGATGSYESLQSSWHAILNAQQKFFLGELSFSEMQSWKWIIGSEKNYIKLTIINLFFHTKKYFNSTLLRIFCGFWPQSDHVRERYIDVTTSNNTFEFTKEFPLFPNPHIRTSGFMMRIKVFNSMMLSSTGLKTDSSKFESGINSLTRQIQNLGQDVLVVGANGEGYRVNEWAESGVFRNEDQSNLLIADNRTNDYPTMTKKIQQTHRVMTWGSNKDLMGVNFNLSDLENSFNVKNELPSLAIVIPTHNGNSLILDTISTVLKQTYSNLKLIVFDNASSIPISQTLRHLKDSRLSIHRSDDFLPVTESWNRAINLAFSDYIMLFGDDDGLSPNFSEDFSKYVVEYDSPDVLYSNLYQVIYPEVKISSASSEFRYHPVCELLEDLPKPTFLDHSVRLKMVANSLELRRDFFYNMPSFVVKRELLNSLRVDDRVFLGPFPDYYISNVLFARAKNLLLIPRPLSFQGISAGSFGHSLLTGVPDRGFERLGESRDAADLKLYFNKYRINFSNYVNEYVITMMQVQRQLQFGRKKVNLKRYRKLTIFNIVKASMNQVQSGNRFKQLLEILQALNQAGKIKIKEYGFVLRIGMLILLSTKISRFFYKIPSVLKNEFQIMQYRPNTIPILNFSPQTPMETFEAIGQVLCVERDAQ